jgi:hypothetical protein
MLINRSFEREREKGARGTPENALRRICMNGEPDESGDGDDPSNALGNGTATLREDSEGCA